MEWTKTPPTKRGQYWAMVKRWFDSAPFVDCIGIGTAGNVIFIDWGVNGPEYDEPFELKDITHWYGPLTPPEPPHD